MFFGDLLLLKENHFFYEKKYDFTQKVTFLIIFYWFQCFDKKQETKHYINFFSLKLYKVSIFNLFWRLNTLWRKQLYHVTIYFFYIKFHKLRFFQFLRVLTAFYIKPTSTSITYAIWIMNFSTFLRVLQYFYVQSIFP